jgi:deoxyribodipyrimidine photo-lyase
MQYLLASLTALAEAIAAKGSRLILVAGKSVAVIPALAKAWRADRVVAQRWVEPFARERDRRIAEATRLELFEGETLLPPGVLRTKAGRPYGVFTQFARSFHDAAQIATPLAAPRSLPPVPRGIRSTAAIPTLRALGITPNPAIVAGGERAARARLRRFVRNADSYAAARDRMDLAGTSRLSQDLKFGTLSPRTAWHAVADATFRNELIWREFTHSTLWDRPELLEAPFQPAWRGFPYRRDARGWKAWVDGTTGYPIVDAAARQLRAEGFVHNRARMVAASFLTKHLLIDYRRGEAHYMKHLTDGDWANNNAGWQWSAGCGCDAQPWFRIFNPAAQAEKHDPDGDYVRRWVPEYGTAKYPRPIVDHAAARQRFLAVAKGHLQRG